MSPRVFNLSYPVQAGHRVPTNAANVAGGGNYWIVRLHGGCRCNTPSLHRRDGNRDSANVMAAIDDLAALVRADVDAVSRLCDSFFAAGNHG